MDTLADTLGLWSGKLRKSPLSALLRSLTIALVAK